MLEDRDLDRFTGQTLFGAQGEKLGTIRDFYTHEEGGSPSFATVNTGLFGTRTHFVPMSAAQISGEGLQVPYDKELLKAAPSIDDDGFLDSAQEDQLYAHYGLDSSAEQPAQPSPVTAQPVVALAEPVDLRSDQASMPTAAQPGGIRLRKYLVTEYQTVTVPVTREEVRLEPESNDAGAATPEGPR